MVLPGSAGSFPASPHALATELTAQEILDVRAPVALAGNSVELLDKVFGQ